MEYLRFPTKWKSSTSAESIGLILKKNAPATMFSQHGYGLHGPEKSLQFRVLFILRPIKSGLARVF
jgi:hypothetical protein